MTSRFLASALSAIMLAGVAVAGPAGASAPAPDAFSPDSYWNTPLPADAPTHPDSQAIVDFLIADNDLDGCITLAGTAGNSWGMPMYIASSSDPVYDVKSTKWSVPPEFSSLRIPVGAQPADNSDGEMVVYDLHNGIVAQLSKAAYSAGKWTVSGGSVAYLDSNGLDGSLPESDEPKNRGTFRGYPGSATFVHYDDVAAGRIDNVLKIGVNTASDAFTFPMIGSDGSSASAGAPAEGMRLRIKEGVNLAALGLTDHALIIARGLQEFGAIIGDQTGGAIVLMVEDTIMEGRGDRWNLNRESLCAIGAEHFEIVADGPLSPSGFTDVVGHPFETEITWLVEQGLTDGCAPGRFCPNAPITRRQMAALLSRALELAPAPSAGFTDTVGDFFEEDIDRLYSAGITAGCSFRQYCPGSLVTRGQMAAFLVRAFELPPADPAGFDDTVSSEFAVEIDRLAASGITKGCTPKSFCPSERVTRGQVAAFLMRAMEG